MPAGVKKILAGLTSARAAVAVMALVAVLSLAGSVIPQGHGHDSYISAYGRLVGGAVVGLGLDQVFHSAYYAAVLVALCAMVVACSLKGLPAKMRAAGKRQPILEDRTLEAMPSNASLILNVEAEEADLHAVEILKRRLYSITTTTAGPRRAAAGSKMAFSRYGSFLLHMSFIFLLAGGIALARFGSHEYRTVAVGDDFTLQVSKEKNLQVSGTENRQVSGTKDLRISVEDFDIEFDDRNRLADYVCDVALRDGGGVLARHTIRPNHPLKYGGKEIYLNSFAEDDAAPRGFVLSVYNSTRSLVVADVTVGVDRGAFVDEIGAMLAVDADAGRVEVAFDDGRRESHLMRQHLTRASDGPSGYQFLVVEVIPSLLVTLEVVREPGQWLIILGLVLLSVGAFSALYLSHRQIWTIVEPLGQGKSRLLLAGRAAKNREGFSREFEAIRRMLEELA